MKVIELFNRNLNKSTIESIDSTTFKEQINLLLNSTLVRLSGKEKAIVIGAGKMNDFSLSFFVKNFEETVLTDVNLLSVNESVRYERLSKKENDRLTRIRIEYTGFEINHFFSDFKERIVNCHFFPLFLNFLICFFFFRSSLCQIIFRPKVPFNLFINDSLSLIEIKPSTFADL